MAAFQLVELAFMHAEGKHPVSLDQTHICAGNDQHEFFYWL